MHYLSIQVRPQRILLRTKEKSHSRQRSVSYGRDTAPLQSYTEVFEHFLAPGNPGREWRSMFVLHFQDARE